MEAAPTRRGFIRLSVIRALLLGLERSMACAMFCRSDRVVRLWIRLYNEGGIDALATKPHSGRPRKVRLQKARDLLVPVLENPKEAGQLHWSGVKLHGWLKEQLGIEISYSTTLRYLHELGYKPAGPPTLRYCAG